MKKPTPTTLYRLWDDRGVLLYIGVTHNLYQRLGAHATEKVWWGEFASHTHEPIPEGRSWVEAERSAIQAELPRYNLKHYAENPYARQEYADGYWLLTAWYADDMRTVKYDLAETDFRVAGLRKAQREGRRMTLVRPARQLDEL